MAAVGDHAGSGPVERILATAGPQVDVPVVMVELRLLGGAVGRPPAQPNAVCGRNAAYSLLVLGPNVPGVGDAVRAAGSAVIDAIDKYRAPGALVNFLGAATDAAQLQSAWPVGDRHWLLRIKSEYDPANLFTVGHGLVSG